RGAPERPGAGAAGDVVHAAHRPGTAARGAYAADSCASEASTFAASARAARRRRDCRRPDAVPRDALADRGPTRSDDARHHRGKCGTIARTPRRGRCCDNGMRRGENDETWMRMAVLWLTAYFRRVNKECGQGGLVSTREVFDGYVGSPLQ